MYVANRAWKSLLNCILTGGQPVEPQGSAGAMGRGTLELLSWQSAIWMNAPIITVPERKLSYRFMFAEAVWILTGDNRVETIAPYAPKIANYSDDGVTFFGAYGPAILAQLNYVIDKLTADPLSRQAVITIWKQNPPNTKDTPCTIATQFLIRRNILFINHTMRSSDAWLGWVYDMFNFSMLGAYVAIALRRVYPDLKLGTITLTAGSQHLYEPNKQPALEIVNSLRIAPVYPTFQIEEFKKPDELIEHLTLLRDEKYIELKKESLNVEHIKKIS